MLHKLLRLIQGYSNHFVPEDQEQLKLLSQQQKNAVEFDHLWQNYYENQSTAQIHQVTCILIEIGLALDEWYNGLDASVHPQAYTCLQQLPQTWQRLMDVDAVKKLSQDEYVMCYQELLKVARSRLHRHFFNEDVE